MKIILNDIEVDDFYKPKCHLTFPLIRKEIELPWPIEQIIQFKEIYVVLLQTYGKVIFNENVFGIRMGQVIWQIEPVPTVHEHSPFTGIFKEGNNVILGNWDGNEYTVDPETGKILKREFTK
jgi:hypothetical protein